MKFRTIVLVFLTAISFSTLADESVGQGKCRAEAEKICPGLTLKTGLVECAKAHKSEFSAECQQKGAEVKAKIKTAISDCKADIKQFCKKAGRGQGKIIKCLKEHSAELQPACQAHVNKN